MAHDFTTTRGRASRLAFGCALICFARPVVAETYPPGGVRIEVPSDAGYNACFSRADGSDIEMATCESAEAAAWDRRLNTAWGRLRATLPPAEFVRLQTAQRGWLAYRDHECRDDGTSGTSGRLAAASCMVRATAIRAAELEARIAR